MSIVRRIISETDSRATVSIYGVHGATGATEFFVDPSDFSNRKTEGGATGFLPYYVYYIDSINWTIPSNTDIQLQWEADTPETFIGLNGSGSVHYIRDYRAHVGATGILASGFTGALKGYINATEQKGWSVTIQVVKDPNYFDRTNPYATS